MSATPAAVRIVDTTPAETGSRAWLVAGQPGDAGVADDVHRRPRAGVLWLHWLGHRLGDRGEFLPLAVELASRGVVSLLPAGEFPWVSDPDGTARDVERVRAQVAAHRAALDHLAAQPGVDPARIAVVGHDYGGMYAALVAAEDERVSTLALQAVDSGWASWFSTYWLHLEGDARVDYSTQFTQIEPVVAVGRSAARLRDGVLFQWAGKDTFVGPDVIAAYERANSLAQQKLYPEADHMLHDRAARDLTAFLAARLGLD